MTLPIVRLYFLSRGGGTRKSNRRGERTIFFVNGVLFADSAFHAKLEYHSHQGKSGVEIVYM